MLYCLTDDLLSLAFKDFFVLVYSKISCFVRCDCLGIVLLEMYVFVHVCVCVCMCVCVCVCEYVCGYFQYFATMDYTNVIRLHEN